MATATAALLARLRRLVTPAPVAAPDADLLMRYVRHRDEAAFAALVERHGPMVLRLALRLLADPHAAEDAFQATFLVLARRAGAIRRRQSVAAWLHGVAYRVALKARAARGRRREQGQGPVPDPADPHPDPLAQVSARELLLALEEEVQQLPETYRLPVVLVSLEGLSQEEASRRLGWTPGQVRGRLERGRKRLHERLVKRGLTLPAALAAAEWCRGAAAAISPALVHSTFKAASAVTAGQAVANMVSPKVMALAEGAVQGMAIKQLTVAAVLAVALGLLGLGAGALAHRLNAGPGPPEQAEEKPQPDVPPRGPEKRPAPDAAAAPGDKPAPGRGRPEQLERFRKLSPAARLQLVEKTLGGNAWQKAARGDMIAAIVERGSVEAEGTNVACPARTGVRGAPATIRWVIDDGTPVKKGERVVEFHDTALRDQLKDQQIRFETARAAAVQADEHRRIVGEEAALEIKLAEVAVKLAKLDLKRFAGKEPTEKQILELKVVQADLLADKVRLQGRARLAQAEVDARAKKGILDQEKQRTHELAEAVKGCVLRAPHDGLAVYHVADRVGLNDRPDLAVGQPVREGQLLLRICYLNRMLLNTRVPEALIARVRAGQRATVLVDAYPGRRLAGQVTEVATTPNAPDWFATGAKLYATRVALTGDLPRLVPGMTAEIHIVTGARTNVMQVPVQAILQAGKERFCYVKTGKGIEERRVVTGLTNDQVVEVTEGVEVGAQVLRNPRVLFGVVPVERKGGK